MSAAPSSLPSRASTGRRCRDFIAECGQRGVEIKWFGGEEPKGFTSTFKHWQYIQQGQTLPETEKILDCLCDFRVPLTFSLEDCQVLATVIKEVMAEMF